MRVFDKYTLNYSIKCKEGTLVCTSHFTDLSDLFQEFEYQVNITQKTKNTEMHNCFYVERISYFYDDGRPGIDVEEQEKHYLNPEDFLKCP